MARNPSRSRDVHAESHEIDPPRERRPDRARSGTRPAAGALRTLVLAAAVLAGCGTDAAGAANHGVDPSRASRIASGSKSGPTTSSGSTTSPPLTDKKYVVPEVA